MSLTERLDKIRSSPKLQNQQHTAVVLNSIDDTLKAEKAEPTPTAYFAALLSLLGQYVSSENGIVNKDLAYAVLYLLDLITPNVPSPLVRAKFSQILTGIAPALAHHDAEAPLIRCAIGCLESLLVVQDAHSWTLPASDVSPRRAIAGLLNLSIDPRPKVRKRSLDALCKVLKSPPPSPSLDHPASDQCAEAALRILSEEAQRAGKAKRNRSQRDEQHEPQLIHALQLIKTIATAANGWPARKIDALCELLLNIAKSSHEYLVMAAFDVFEIIFASLADELSSAKLPRLLEVITELQPSKDDSQLLPPWIAVLSRGYDVAAQIEPEDTFTKLPGLLSSVSRYLSSPSHNIRVSASECLVSFLKNCIPASIILEPSIMDEKTFERLAKVADELLSIKYQAAWMEVFNVVSAMFESFKWRSNPTLRNALKAIGDLRGNEAFAGKKEADVVISAAIRAAGADFVLEVLPLNLLKPQPGQAGRAWLLPLMRGAVQNTRLAHFRSELVPLSEAMFQRVLDHGNNEKTMEIKIYETIVQQVWATLPGYCDQPIDLVEAFDQSFAELLANLLYQQPQLRTELCRSLQNLVVTNQAIQTSEGEEDLVLQGRISKQQASENLTHLAGVAGNLLAVLFNVYGETLPQYRGLILQCINAYLSVLPQQELTETFERVAGMLEAAISQEGSQTQADKQKDQNKKNKMPPTSHTLMDLVITMSIHLPRTSFAALFNMAANVVDKGDDPQLQKKAYKLIPRLAESETGREALKERNIDLQQLLLNSAAKATAPAKRDRMDAIAQVIPSLDNSDMHFIPAVLSEIVIGVKEVNEKARTAAFDVLVLMGEKMSEGGTVVNAKVSHMPDDAPPVAASLEEYFTMVSAGLAGSTPHMISASITALARLLYEFRARLSPAAISDLVQTIDLFLTSANREIVRSCLGFVKVCVLSLPTDMMLPRLETLVPNLCVWSHEHKAHFKAKVKHIFERMVKRFGAATIEKYTPEADRKLIVNIRKTRDRAQRKKDATANGDMDEDEQPTKRKGKFESEYDEALYASDDDEAGSESDISDDEVLGRAAAKGQRRAASRGETYIVEDEDEPLDLLDKRALAHVSTTMPAKGKAEPKGRKAARTDLDGKLVFNEEDSDEEMAFGEEGDELDGDPGDGTLEGGINAYVAAIKGKDAARRGLRGKLKFKNTRGEEDEVDEEEVKSAVQAQQDDGGRGKFSGGGGRGGRVSKGPFRPKRAGMRGGRR
ncbi:NUC173-domain-containing protein [Myriangium duriaei CBS 260.36]|uniref:NUC173-domain-containing protein n=1 Tax=Myriangium duriaei CBS 260.36 TaxID=1168546 RepID=A0A9P4J204_9PEZI|nr:NUC173-domain-containing protein [Myriangium duriaei CBS 260.36]